MTVHMIKLCVGAASIEDLAQWQTSRLAQSRKATGKAEIWHTTRMEPKRRDEMVDGAGHHAGAVPPDLGQELVAPDDPIRVGRQEPEEVRLEAGEPLDPAVSGLDGPPLEVHGDPGQHEEGVGQGDVLSSRGSSP